MSATPRPGPQFVAKSARRIEPAIGAALLCVLVGWFFTDTLQVAVGPMRNSIRFLELPAIIGNPTALFTFHRSHPLALAPFAAVCCLALLAPLAPQFRKERIAWLALCAPLVLMCICAALLFLRTRGAVMPAAQEAGSTGWHIARLAADFVNRGGVLAVQRVSIAAGAYLAMSASVYLAVRGVLGFRAHNFASDQSGVRSP